MYAHASQAFSIAHCTDLEDLPMLLTSSIHTFILFYTYKTLVGNITILQQTVMKVACSSRFFAMLDQMV